MSYLGVNFDRTLCFDSHVSQAIIKARKGLSALRITAGTCIEQRLLVLLFQAIVLSPIEYALSILTFSATQIERLEKVQNEAMRIILGCTKDKPCVTMRLLLDFPTMENKIMAWRARSYLRISADTQHPLHSELPREKGNRLARGKSWLGRAEDVVKLVVNDIAEIEAGPEWVSVPLDFKDAFPVVVTLDRGGRELTPVAINTEIKALIDENTTPGDALIYTDGSVIRNEKSGYAFVVMSSGKIIHEASGAYAMTTSSMTMEIMAVTQALRWMEGQDYTHACVLSDSLSMIRKIQTGQVRRSWLESIGRSRVIRVTFIFVPGHVGVCGNERADKLAGLATVSEGLPMDRADILNNIRDIGRARDFGDTSKSSSLPRMYELEIKKGIAKNERWSGRTRAIVNQHRTGTISRCTLLQILERRAEHLWTCPVCNDVIP